MYLGHGSWIGHGSGIAFVIFVGLFVMRVVTSQRRRRGYGGPISRGSFTATDRQGPAGGPPAASPGSLGATSTGIAPGWLTDPFAKHDQRYWSGTEWTEHVTDNGVPATDPPPQSPDEQGAD